jgi:bacteriocin-like protein
MAHKNAKKSLPPAAFEVLSDNDLNKVAGGSMAITKRTDVSSPNLVILCSPVLHR